MWPSVLSMGGSASQGAASSNGEWGLLGPEEVHNL